MLFADSTTRSITTLPAGIVTPLDPCTDSLSVAETLSPTCWVLVQMRTAGCTANVRPASTVPVGASTMAGAAAGADAAPPAADEGAWLSGVTTTVGAGGVGAGVWANVFGLCDCFLGAGAGAGAETCFAGASLHGGCVPA